MIGENIILGIVIVVTVRGLALGFRRIRRRSPRPPQDSREDRHPVYTRSASPTGRFACPCCGYLTLPEAPPGTFALCPVCWWEDDGVQFRDPDYEGGANGPSLNQAREHFKLHGASEPRFRGRVRPPTPSESPEPSENPSGSSASAPTVNANLDPPWPFKGRVVWLAESQGGRRTPPWAASKVGYAATAFVPPGTFETALASFVLRGFEDGALVSGAEGRWLIIDNDGRFTLTAGAIAVVTEGARTVAYFQVDEVDDAALPSAGTTHGDARFTPDQS